MGVGRRLTTLVRLRLLVAVAVLAAVLAADGRTGTAPWLTAVLAADAVVLAAVLALDRRTGRARPAGAPEADRPGSRDATAPDVPSPESVVLRTVCHEFRTPVTSLGSLTRALSDGGRTVAPHVRQQIAQLAHDHAVHLEGLLRQAAAVTQGLVPAPAARRLPLHRVVPAAAGVVPRQRLCTMVSAEAAQGMVDAQRVQHILTNLLENAVRHGPADGEVRLGAWTDRRGLVLSVCDEGTLSPALSEALSRSVPPVGMSGLGLWVVRRLVADQNGTVAARDDGHGLLVEVVLPRPAGD